MVTRYQMDTWCEKRPAYAAGSIPAQKCLNVASMTPNYYVSCTTTGGKMPTYDELTKINFAEISIKNNDTVTRSIRIGYKVYGSNDSITWTDYQNLNAGITGTYVMEGFAASTNYAIYVQCTDYINMYAFVDNDIVATITDGYGYFGLVLTGTAQKSPKVIQIYAAELSVQLRVVSPSPYTDVELSRTVTFAYQYNTQDVTFDIPWNTPFSIIISGVNASENNVVTGLCTPDTNEITNGSFMEIYSELSGCEYEFCTGSDFVTNLFEVEIFIP